MSSRVKKRTMVASHVPKAAACSTWSFVTCKCRSSRQGRDGLPDKEDVEGSKEKRKFSAGCRRLGCRIVARQNVHQLTRSLHLLLPSDHQQRQRANNIRHRRFVSLSGNGKACLKSSQQQNNSKSTASQQHRQPLCSRRSKTILKSTRHLLHRTRVTSKRKLTVGCYFPLLELVSQDLQDSQILLRILHSCTILCSLLNPQNHRVSSTLGLVTPGAVVRTGLRGGPHYYRSELDS